MMPNSDQIYAAMNSGCTNLLPPCPAPTARLEFLIEIFGLVNGGWRGQQILETNANDNRCVNLENRPCVAAGSFSQTAAPSTHPPISS